VFLAGGDDLAYEPLDAAPVAGGADQPQPGGAGVAELVLVVELVGEHGAQEQGVQRVEGVKPVRSPPVVLGHAQRAVAERVGAGQADPTGWVEAYQAGQRRRRVSAWIGAGRRGPGRRCSRRLGGAAAPGGLAHDRGSSAYGWRDRLMVGRSFRVGTIATPPSRCAPMASRPGTGREVWRVAVGGAPAGTLPAAGFAGRVSTWLPLVMTAASPAHTADNASADTGAPARPRGPRPSGSCRPRTSRAQAPGAGR